MWGEVEVCGEGWCVVGGVEVCGGRGGVVVDVGRMRRGKVCTVCAGN